MDKEENDTYENLVDEVKKAYGDQQRDADYNDVHMNWVGDEFGKEMTEINLWTYWQGYGVRNPKILLVGQDWGCCEQIPQAIKNAREIEATKGKTEVQYLDDNQKFITDRNLVKLFAVLGYKGICCYRNDDLFFTNFCLGYRNKGNSGAFKNEWLTRDSKFFIRLVDILRPKIILCLGKKTYTAVAKAAKAKPKGLSGGFNKLIRSQFDSPIEYNGIPILALAHPGGQGTANRLRGVTKRPKEALDVQREDWRLVKRLMDERQISPSRLTEKSNDTMSQEEFVAKARDCGYSEKEIRKLICCFVTDHEKYGIPPEPYKDIPLFYKRY